MPQSSLIRTPFIQSPLHHYPATFRQLIGYIRHAYPALVMVTRQSNPGQPKIGLVIEPEQVTLRVKKRSGYHVYCYRDAIQLVTLDQVPADYHDICSMMELVKWLVQRVQMGEGSLYIPNGDGGKEETVIGGIGLRGSNDTERMVLSKKWLEILKGGDLRSPAGLTKG